MSRNIMLIPTDVSVGLINVILGVVCSIERKGLNLSVFKPIAQPSDCDKDHTIEVLRSNSSVHISEPLKMSYVKSLLANNQKNILMEEIIALYHDNTQKAEVILIEGLIPTRQHVFAQSLNYDIANMLDADVILVTALGHKTQEELKERIKLTSIELGGIKSKNIAGIIINQLHVPVDEYGLTRPDLLEIFDEPPQATIKKIDIKTLNNHSPLPILCCIPWNFDLMATRCIDIANYLNASIINEGTLQVQRIQSIVFCTSSLQNTVKLFRSGTLLVTSSDRYDVIVSACLSAMNGIEIGGLLLTDGYSISESIHKLCSRAFEKGLPVLVVNNNTWQTALSLQNFSLEVHADDHERIKKIQNYVACHINQQWIDLFTTNSTRPKRLSPHTFCYQLTALARKAKKRIVLPEGNEPRTVKAAAICAKRGIANCILLGEYDEIKHIASAQGVELGIGIEIIAPRSVWRNYIARLVELRKNKGMTEIAAREQLADNVVLGTMMLERNEVDGLVSGITHTTANTIRPPLKIIKPAMGSSIVSSIFFMLLPEQVLVYGDCAINPNPTAEQLSEIAIQSAASAKAFGIEPRVAMISYSTGNSGVGNDVEKVRQATHLAKEKWPNLIIDGPLQYDAAIMEDVAKFKAPNSPVAGKATVFIFPDLNTGNTTYKAVQRSANLLSIGPMLQGMRKPVNDLSRGASVDDIVYTIAITAIQAAKNN
ncbi:MAG: phosphate acetyltransferase [Candidatus Arsenophonus melophagi]|nr:phosphate acetyltransferase [Candidatus Arsenophonus melophagi]